MPTKQNRVELLFTDAQLEDLRLRFPDFNTVRELIYEQLGLEAPKIGGNRPGTGRPKGSKTKKAKRKKLKPKPE